MAAIYTSSEAHAGPLAAAEVAALLGSGGLPEGTSLWREDSSERRVPTTDGGSRKLSMSERATLWPDSLSAACAIARSSSASSSESTARAA